MSEPLGPLIIDMTYVGPIDTESRHLRPIDTEDRHLGLIIINHVRKESRHLGPIIIGITHVWAPRDIEPHHVHTQNVDTSAR